MRDAHTSAPPHLGGARPHGHACGFLPGSTIRPAASRDVANDIGSVPPPARRRTVRRRKSDAGHGGSPTPVTERGGRFPAPPTGAYWITDKPGTAPGPPTPGAPA